MTVPEPTHVAPVVSGALRASDADRDQVATLLSTAFAEGRITREEHDERLDAVLRAKTFDDLVPITRDLVPAPSVQPLIASTPATTTSNLLDTSYVHDEPERMVAIFSGATRKGRYRMRRSTQTVAVFGGVDLDLREATFEAPVVEITGLWCFGGLDIKVPDAVEVRDETIGIFGGADVSKVAPATPGAPVLVIKGLALFGGVSVRGSSSRDRRKAGR